MPNRRTQRCAFVAMLSLVATLTTTAARADRPSWQSLPDETFVMVRVPNLAELFDALRTRTKLGAVVFDDKRLAGVQELILSEVEDDWNKVLGDLKQLGLEPTDFAALTKGELGYAGTVTARDANIPLYIGLAWSECGEATADKLLAALDPLLKMQPEGLRAIRREDLDIAGIAARHLIVPTVGPEHGTVTLSVGVKDGKPIADGTVTPAKDPPAKEKVLTETHIVVGRRGKALLAAHVTVIAGEENNSAAAVERLKTMFAQFVESHSAGGEGVVSRLLQTAGVAETLPDGVPVIEALGDAGVLMRAAEVATDWQPTIAVLKSAGFDKLGTIAYRSALDGTTLRSGFFLALPQPRAGLATIVDQTTLKPQPADWVSNDAVGYQFLSFDLAKAYALATELARKQSNEAAGGIDAFELQVRGLLQVEPQALLSSLGRTHTLVTFVPASAPAAVEGDEKAERPEADPTALALVWRLNDEPLWRRLMSMAAETAVKQIVTEQGFSGLRLEQDKVSAAWFVGSGYMVVAVGKGVPERTLTMLRKAPTAEASLLGGPVGRRAAELLPSDEVIAYELTNGPSLVKLFNQAMLTTFERDADPDDAVKMKALWPTEAEWEGAVGISVAGVVVNKHGIVYRSAADLPPP